MTVRILGGLRQLVGDYDLFIVDLWGTLHDGAAVFPGARDCLVRLRRGGARVVLLTNAARLRAPVAAQLAKLGVRDDFYDRLLTSGEATAEILAADAGVPGATAGPAYYYLGPDRSRATLAACGGRETDFDEADIIFCTGLVDDEREGLEAYRGLLREGVERALPMVCVNPDSAVIRGGQTIACAGALAALYEELGGRVQRFGKPMPAIFDRLFAECPGISRSRALMVGDGLVTDIRGARLAGIDALWIAGGLHAEALALGRDGRLQADRVQAVAEEAGERPAAVLPWLRW